MIIIGLADERLFHKAMAGHFSHGFKNPNVLDTAADKLAFHHTVASCGKLHACPFFCVSLSYEYKLKVD